MCEVAGLPFEALFVGEIRGKPLGDFLVGPGFHLHQVCVPKEVKIRRRAFVRHTNTGPAGILGSTGMKRLVHVAHQMGDVVKRESPRHDRRVFIGDDCGKPFESFNHAVQFRAVACLIVASGVFGNTDVVEGIEISYASPLVIWPNGCLRQRHASGKDLFDFLARLRGEIRLSDQTDDAMAFVEPRKSRRKCQQMKDEKCREESSSQRNERRWHYEISTLTKAGCRDPRLGNRAAACLLSTLCFSVPDFQAKGQRIDESPRDKRRVRSHQFVYIGFRSRSASQPRAMR